VELTRDSAGLQVGDLVRHGVSAKSASAPHFRASGLTPSPHPVEFATLRVSDPAPSFHRVGCLVRENCGASPISVLVVSERRRYPGRFRASSITPNLHRVGSCVEVHCGASSITVPVVLERKQYPG
jgi:hypothetical protein